jgi:NADH-ubiquinone oxidoreductase chain 5
MEGPTPVSALIHAATLVVSGVFLIIRCSSLFENSNSILIFVAVIGALTSFFAASVGLFQNDLKRVIAYSTCSQLGYMVFITGLSHYSVSMFHLANHAVFKALLFLSAGCIIHGLSDEQDLRKMGSLLNFFPVSYVMILIGSLALIGTPFLTGFYSKDCILELSIAKHSFIGNFCYFLGCSAAFCTSFYSFRLIFLTFIVPTNSFKSYIQEVHEAPIKMLLPLMILAIGSIFYGFFSRDLVIGLGSLFYNLTFTNFCNFDIIDSEFLSSFIKNIPLLFTCLGAFFSLLLICCYNISKDFVFEQKTLKQGGRFFYKFLNKKWYFDQLVNEFVAVKLMNFGYFSSFQTFDKGFIEKIGPSGFTTSFFSFSSNQLTLLTVFIYHSFFLLILSMIFFISVFFSQIFVYDISFQFLTFTVCFVFLPNFFQK